MTADTLLTLLAAVFSLAGSFFLLVAGIGILRLPDAYCRSHALGKAMTLGLSCLLIAMGCAIPGLAWWKVALAIAFQLVTIPVASHLFCLIAYKRRLPYWSARGWTRDDTRPPV
jgi:multicomponent Na+:H+ antiporter subunit G